MKKVLVSVLLIAGLFAVAFFTYKAHKLALVSAEQVTDLEQAVSDYDFVLFQITNAYQQNLIYALSRERADMDNYFASEDRIYEKLSQIEQLTSSIDGLMLPSDSLRPLVARQFLKMERYRLRASDAAPEASLEMLDEALDDQKRIERLISSDTEKLKASLSGVSHSGLLTPVFIFFLFLCGAAGLLYARGQLASVFREAQGMEDKLRRNQELLHTQINQNEVLRNRIKTIMDLSGQIFLILEPVFAYGEVEDFKVLSANEEAREVFALQEGAAVKPALRNPPTHIREMTEIMGWLTDTFESGKPSRRSFRIGSDQGHQKVVFNAAPHEGQLYMNSLGNMELSSDSTVFQGIPESMFSITGCYLAELSPQGKVIRANATMQSDHPAVEGHYLWDVSLYSDQDSKHELRKLIRELNRGDRKFGSFRKAWLAGVFNDQGILISILYILHEEKNRLE